MIGDKFEITIEPQKSGSYWFSVKNLNSGGTCKQPYDLLTERQMINLRRDINKALTEGRKIKKEKENESGTSS